MQAKDLLRKEYEKLIEKIRSESKEFSRFQIVVIITLLLLIGAGAAFSYFRSRPREIEVNKNKVEVSNISKRKLVVHVAGEVMKPGVYQIDEGSRVADAIEAAGGARPEGNLNSLNLAARLKDGEKIMVTKNNEPSEVGAAEISGSSEGGSLINLNTAGVEEIEKLPGIGPELSKRIVEYREKAGQFSSVEELSNVEGIGKKRLDSIKGLVTI